MSNRHPLTGMIFTDGRIARVVRNDDGAVMVFEDYSGGPVRLVFAHLFELEQSDQMTAYEVVDARLGGAPGRWSVELRDDDGDLLFRAVAGGITCDALRR